MTGRKKGSPEPGTAGSGLPIRWEISELDAQESSALEEEQAHVIMEVIEWFKAQHHPGS
jgi:hypothetical protein